MVVIVTMLVPSPSMGEGQDEGEGPLLAQGIVPPHLSPLPRWGEETIIMKIMSLFDIFSLPKRREETGGSEEIVTQ